MRKFLIFAVMSVLLIGAAACVSAADSGNETLEKSYYYDADADKEYVDDTVVTHNVVKYYGDSDTKFRVKVYDEDYAPAEDVYVKFKKNWGSYKVKTTNSKGVVSFPLNYKVGKYYTETLIDCDDGESYFYATNTVRVKSTIPTGELCKYSHQKGKKLSVKFLNTKGKKLTDTFVKLKVQNKIYRLKTDSRGTVRVKFNSLGAGCHKITAYNPVSKEKRKISVVILKRGVHRVNVRIDDPTDYFPIKKLSNGDRLSTVYETKNAQYAPGVYVQCNHKALDDARHTKLIKAKFFFKNKKTGKTITKTSSRVSHDVISLKPLKGYSPYKVRVWYRDRK